MLSSDGFDGGRCGFFAAVHGRTMEGSRWAAAWRGARKPGRRPRMAVFIAASKEVARREAVSGPRRLVPVVATDVGRVGLAVCVQVCGGGLAGPCGGLQLRESSPGESLALVAVQGRRRRCPGAPLSS